MPDSKLLAVRGSLYFLVDAGKDPQTDRPLGRVYSLVDKGYVGDVESVDSIVARGYWDDLSKLDPATRAQVEDLVAAAR